MAEIMSMLKSGPSSPVGENTAVSIFISPAMPLISIRHRLPAPGAS